MMAIIIIINNIIIIIINIIIIIIRFNYYIHLHHNYLFVAEEICSITIV